TISNNTAQRDGGGIFGSGLNFLNGTVTGNRAEESGGGIFVINMTLEDGMISNNTAGEYGGGIRTEQDFEINGGTISGNTALDGGGVYVLGEPQLNSGLITANIATDNGGGIYLNGSASAGNTVISGNTAANDGGGVYVNGTILVTAATVEGNTATAGYGGGIYSAGAFTLGSGTISGNSAGLDGGGIYCPAPNSFITGGMISNNTAQRDGGGYCGTIVFVLRGTITGNRAAEYGGGLFVEIITLEDGTIAGNTAGEFGGGIYAQQNIEINGGEISGNTAANGGGVSALGEIDFNEGSIIGNTALADGGGIYGTLADITAGFNAVFADNTAARGYLIKEEDKALYASLIATTQITQPFTYAYNNFDINYIGIEIMYVVEFDSQGGSAVEPESVVAGSTVARPTDPTRDGYTFTGWYQDAGATDLWDFATAINRNRTLYAGWKENPNTYTVTFDSRGGSAVSAITGIDAGSKINAPADPTRDGYTFTGWYVDEAGTTLWNFVQDVVNGNMTLYAGWKTAAATTTTDVPKTDDTTDIGLYVSLIVAAGAGLAGTLVWNRYKHKKQ
ncbi:MAG: InlB B-repeat-containing protein, partial [Christensenella sp.]|uniref:InlB B-repeat-containing protein n=1 Tax=Christensenella sp. TaxID=1935934 RepID=UPI002B1F16E1